MRLYVAAIIALCLSCLSMLQAQKILSYSPDELTAFIHYSECLYGIYRK
jgi:flagellar motor switch protein FliG